MSAPLVVNTKDGTCWTRRMVTTSGLALYAPEGVCKCPEFVMATLAELAEHGIVGSADALPVPVGRERPERLTAAERDMVLGLIADAKPASSGLVLSFAASVRNRREHDHPKWEDFYCLNLSSYMGERSGPVLRRLVDVEVENEQLRDRVAELEAQREADHKTWQHDLATARGEREATAARITELEAERHSTNEALDDAVLALRTRDTEPAKRTGQPAEWCTGCNTDHNPDECGYRPEADEPAGECRCHEPDADPYACEAEDCKSEFSELNPFGGGPVQGHDAKVSRTCGCGWSTSVWHVDDGSAEEELHRHVVRSHGGISPQKAGA